MNRVINDVVDIVYRRWQIARSPQAEAFIRSSAHASMRQSELRNHTAVWHMAELSTLVWWAVFVHFL